MDQSTIYDLRVRVHRLQRLNFSSSQGHASGAREIQTLRLTYWRRLKVRKKANKLIGLLVRIWQEKALNVKITNMFAQNVQAICRTLTNFVGNFSHIMLYGFDVMF